MPQNLTIQAAIKHLETMCKQHNLGCPVEYCKHWSSVLEALGAAYMGMRVS